MNLINVAVGGHNTIDDFMVFSREPREEHELTLADAMKQWQ